jgi:hypothetical protein
MQRPCRLRNGVVVHASGTETHAPVIKAQHDPAGLDAIVAFQQLGENL